MTTRLVEEGRPGPSRNQLTGFRDRRRSAFLNQPLQETL